jgi:hypothetical protein
VLQTFKANYQEKSLNIHCEISKLSKSQKHNSFKKIQIRFLYLKFQKRLFVKLFEVASKISANDGLIVSKLFSKPKSRFPIR